MHCSDSPATRAGLTQQDFYEDIFEEMGKYGEVENLNVCDNTSDHMVGNVYVKFREEEEAVAAMTGLAGRFYGGASRLCLTPTP
jgi:splicing factor U2AF subunit